MKRFMFWFVVLWFLSLPVQVFSVEAKIVDNKDVKVELTSVETREIDFYAGGFELTIRIAGLSTMRRSEDGKTLILKTVTGREIEGFSESELEGTWELGDYSINLRDIKSVDFGWVDQTKQKTISGDQPNGFYAICTDWTGATMELVDFQYHNEFYFKAYPKSSSGWHSLMLEYLPIVYKEVITGIPFTDIDTIHFTDTQREHREWKPALNIKLVDGSLLKGKLGREGEVAPRFFGEAKNGNLVERIRQVVFNHKRDKNERMVITGKYEASVVGDLNSTYNFSIKTWQGNQILFQNGCRFRLDRGYVWTYDRTDLHVSIGQSSNDVDFEKIRSIRFKEKGGCSAQMTTTSGNTIDIYLPNCKDIWLGGNWDKFGPARILMSEVSSLEIFRNTEN